MNRIVCRCVPLLLALLPVGVYAAPAKKTASVPRILTWISQHLNQTANWDDDQGKHHTFQYALDFTGCKVTLTRVMDGDTKFIYGPFDLKYVAPSEIGVSKAADNRPFVSLGFLHLVPRKVVESQEDKPPQSGIESFAMIYFPSQDLADRQARAWHDAVVACGGKSVPDNLY